MCQGGLSTLNSWIFCGKIIRLILNTLSWRLCVATRGNIHVSSLVDHLMNLLGIEGKKWFTYKALYRLRVFGQ